MGGPNLCWEFARGEPAASEMGATRPSRETFFSLAEAAARPWMEMHPAIHEHDVTERASGGGRHDQPAGTSADHHGLALRLVRLSPVAPSAMRIFSPTPPLLSAADAVIRPAA